MDRSNQSILKENNPEYSLEGLMLKLKFQYSGHLMQRADSLEKTLMLGKILRPWQEIYKIPCKTKKVRKCSGKESICQCRRHRRCRFNPWVQKSPWRSKQQPTPVLLAGKFHGQRILVDCSPRVHKESGTTELLSARAAHTYEEKKGKETDPMMRVCQSNKRTN